MSDWEDVDSAATTPSSPQPVAKQSAAGWEDIPVDTGPAMAPASDTAYTFSMEGLRSFGLRTKLGFADGPKEKLDILRANNVDATLVGDQIHYLDPKTKEVKQIDETGFSVYDIADVIGGIPEFVGMVVGGTGGAIAGAKSGPAGAIAGGAMGSSEGSMAGAKVRTDVARWLGADISSEEESARIRDAGISGLLADPTGRLIAKGVQKVLAPAASKLVAGFREANKTLGNFTDARGRPLHLSPAQGTTSGWVDTFENVAEGSFFGRGPLIDANQLKQQALETTVRDLVTSISKGSYSKEEYGALVQDAILKKGQIFRTLENKVWGEVDKLSPNVGISTARVSQWAQEQLSKTSQARTLAPSISGKRTPQLPKPIQEITWKDATPISSEEGVSGWKIGDVKITAKDLESADGNLHQAIADKLPAGAGLVDILSDMAALPPGVSFSTAHEWISQLAAKTRKGSPVVLNTKEVGVIKDLNRQLNMAVDDAGKTLKGSELVDAYKTARNFTKEWRQTFDNKLVATLANAEPQKVAEVMFKPNNIESLREARKAMGPAAFQKVKGAWVGNMFKPDGLDVAGTAIEKRVAKWDDPTLREILDKPGELLQFTNLVNTIKLTQGSGVSSGTPGKMAVQLAQPGALLYLAQNVVRGRVATIDNAGAAAVVLSPAIIGKVFASPGGAKWLTEGFKAPAGTEAATRAVAAITAIAFQDSKGMTPEGIKFLSQQEAARLEEKAAKANRNAKLLQNKRDAVPLTAEQEASLNKDYPGASRMSYDDLVRLESSIR